MSVDYYICNANLAIILENTALNVKRVNIKRRFDAFNTLSNHLFFHQSHLESGFVRTYTLNSIKMCISRIENLEISINQLSYAKQRGKDKHIGYMANYPIINGKVSNKRGQRILAGREHVKMDRHR